MSLTAAVYMTLFNHLEKYSVTFHQNSLFTTLPSVTLKLKNYVQVKNGDSADIVSAAKNACSKLNKYYPKTDGLVYFAGTST
jgi:hypothetical protein